MNNQLIEKVISSDDCNACPEFTYKNPLVDRTVAGALAKSFVKMLVAQDSNINNNLRNSVLANIRKICKTGPENHVEVEESFTDSLTEVYMNKITSQNPSDTKQSTERSLDEFLMRNMKDIDINNNSKQNNPEVIQALVNLNRNNSKLSSITKNVLHWDVTDRRSQTLVKDLWTNCCDISLDDISIKNKTVIEAFLLNICFTLLTEINIKLEELFSQEKLRDLLKKCSISPECFQICIRILNSLFVQTNYNDDIQCFITKFIFSINENCTIAVLYPVHLRHIVVLLNIDLELLPIALINQYKKDTLTHLKLLHEKSEDDLILLLAHYAHWFDIYFDTQM